MRKIRLLLASIGIISLSLTPALPVSATDVFEDVCRNGAAADSTVCEQEGDDPLTGNEGIIIRAANVISVIGGVIAVIIMMYGGFLYITSRGDANKAATGRNAIIYAAIGLIIIVLAQSVVALVLSNI